MIITRLQHKKVIVFYGSQTGTAEEFAARLAKQAARHGMPAMTFDPEECTDWVSIIFKNQNFNRPLNFLWFISTNRRMYQSLGLKLRVRWQYFVWPRMVRVTPQIMLRRSMTG